MNDWFLYELQCIDYHAENTKHLTKHWNYIPEKWLFDSGWIIDTGEARRMRKKCLEKEINLYCEYGLDGMGKDENGTYHGIQIKCRSDRKITPKDVSTFSNVIIFRLRRIDDRSKGYLYSTTKLHKEMAIDWSSRDIFKHKILPRQLEEEETDKVLETDLVLTTIQRDFVDFLNNGWMGCRGLKMPCGTGKTLVFSTHLRESDYNIVIIASPLRVHARQTLERVKYFLPNHKRILYDCDKNGTLEFGRIRESLEKGDKILISTTFISLVDIGNNIFGTDKEAELSEEEVESKESSSEDEEDEEYEEIIQSKYDLSKSLLIVDESHNVTKGLDETISLFPRRLSVSATPVENRMSPHISYEYSLSDAIREEIVCDYRVLLPDISITKEEIEIPKELSKFENNATLKQCIFLTNGLLKEGCRNGIVYLSSVEECKVFKRILKGVMEDYHYIEEGREEVLSYSCEIIDYKTSTNKREKILTDFERLGGSHFKIILSVRILDEGINLKRCDFIFITKPSDKRGVRTVQRCFRANRKDIHNPSKIAKLFLYSEDITDVIYSLTRLREEDPEFSKKVESVRMNYERKESREEERNIEERINLELRKFIYVKCRTVEEILEEKRGSLIEYCKEKGDYPKDKQRIKEKRELTLEEEEEHRLSRFLSYEKWRIKREGGKSSGLYKRYENVECLKKSIDDFLIENFTTEERDSLLIEFVRKKRRLPKKREKPYKGCNIGVRWNTIKQCNFKKSLKSNDTKKVKEIYSKFNLPPFTEDLDRFRENFKDKNP